MQGAPEYRSDRSDGNRPPGVSVFHPRGPVKQAVLPAELNTFIGRESELAQLLSAIKTARLLTISGTGGVGKTRIALQLARLLQAQGRSVQLIELAPLTDEHLLLQKIADHLGVREQSPRSLLELVRDYLESAESILVLDNCEHLARACAELAETLLIQCPKLRIVATSREALRVPGELLWVLAPLTLPHPASDATNERNQSEAMRLFVDRATTRSPHFKLTKDNAAVVGRICHRLDGLPLAIELAAASVNVLAPDQIEARLDDRVRSLVSARRTATARQQTLSATFDWSYALLSPEEQRVFERLSVFAGPFELEAAEAVCGARPVGSAHVLDYLTELINKSLVLAESDRDGVRYRLLQTVCQYAYERLCDRNEVDNAHHRQAEWYAQMTEVALRDLRSDERGQRQGGQGVWLARLEREHDNLRGALSWCLQREQTDLALRLGAGVARFWLYHGHLSEGRGWLSRIFGLVGDGYPPYADGTPYMDALFNAGMLASSQGDFAAARQVFERVLRLTSGPTARLVRGGAHIQLANLAAMQGDLTGARNMFELAIEILGSEARWMVANATMGMSRVLLRQGDSVTARRLTEESLATYRDVADERQTAGALLSLGDIHAAERRLDEARACLREGLTISRAIADPISLVIGLAYFASLAVAERHPEQALRLLGAAATFVETGARGFTAQRLDLDGRMQSARDMLAARVAEAALAAGRKLTLEEAVDEALGTPARAPEPPAGPLSRREGEVAELIARGLTNRQIAERLVISERTADNHVANILSKLSFSTRAQIAAWTIERGLATGEAGDT
jgi:non-specific serine/threonine protein kinase